MSGARRIRLGARVAAAAASVACGSCSGITGPDLSAAVAEHPIADGVVAYLFLEADSVGLGEIVNVWVRVQNSRRRAVVLTSAEVPPGSVFTSVSGESVILEGGSNPKLPTVEDYRIGARGGWTQTWELIAREHHHHQGRYDLTVRLSLMAVDGAPAVPINLDATFVVQNE